MFYFADDARLRSIWTKETTAKAAGAADPAEQPFLRGAPGSSDKRDLDAEQRARQQSESGRRESLLPGLEGNALDDSAVDAERLEKINKLKKAMADGTYHVSAEEVARKIIEHMREPKRSPKAS